MGSLSDAMDDVIERIATQYPHSIGVYTRTQAATFAFAEYCVPLGSGLDLARYQLLRNAGFCPVLAGQNFPREGVRRCGGGISSDGHTVEGDGTSSGSGIL